MHRQAVCHTIADNLLLCNAFSKNGSTVYLMFQQKNKICLSIAFFFFLAPSLKKKKERKKKYKQLMMGVGLCDHTANAQISILQLFLCDIVCFHSKCK